MSGNNGNRSSSQSQTALLIALLLASTGLSTYTVTLPSQNFIDQPIINRDENVLAGNVAWWIAQQIDATTANALASLQSTYNQPKIIADIFWLNDIHDAESGIVPQITAGALATMQGAGIKVYQHLDGHPNALVEGTWFDNLDANDYNLMVSWIDDTLTLLPDIDGFWVDPRIVASADFRTFYLNVIAYIHGLGKEAIINLSSAAIWGFGNAFFDDVATAADYIFIEDSWPLLTSAMVAANSGKYVANCWGGAYAYASPASVIPPYPTDYPAYPMSWSEAESLTVQAWDIGVSYFSGTIAPIETWVFSSYTSNVAAYLSIIYKTTTTLTLSSSTITQGSTITALATVTGNSGTPTGTLKFYVSSNGGSTWNQTDDTRTLFSGHVTSVPIGFASAGTYLFKAEYLGDGTYLASTSNIAALTVIAAPPPTPPPPAQYFYVHILSGSGGYTVPTGNLTYLVGQTASVSAYANQHYTFWHWLLNGSVSTTNYIINIVGTANTTYTVQPEFNYVTPPTPSPTSWTLTMSYSGVGTVVPGVGSHAITSLTQALTAYAGNGYVFSRWIIDGVTVETDNPYMLTAAYGETHTATAVFEPASSPTPIASKETTPMFNKIVAQLSSQTPKTFADMVLELQKAGIENGA